MRLTCLTMMLLMFAGGCTNYGFDITDPKDLAREVRPKQETVIQRDELEYNMTAYESRLIMRILNTTDEPIELVGPESYAVAPNNQSHPLRSQSIAPHSFMKLILPPVPMVIRDPGPRFGIGLGVGVSRGYGRRGYYGGGGIYDPIWDEPVYLAVEGDPGIYWEWEGETDVRLRLVYRTKKETFRHDWGIHRRKL